MNKKGQALVEFIIILPIFLVLVLGVVDIGKILYSKTRLEGEITDVITMYKVGKSEDDIKQALDDGTLLDISLEEEDIVFHLTKEIDIITPGLNLIFDNPYSLEVSRSTTYE